MELDPRLREEREPSDRPIESPYTYPPTSAAATGPGPYSLNSIHPQPPSPQQRNIGALPSLSQPGLGSYYSVQQDQRPLQHHGLAPAEAALAGAMAMPHGQMSLDGDAPKRPRACEACRGLKVKCDFEGDADVCKRCAKANRECIVTAPNRRRPKKTDTRVADLEKRVEDLQATLQEHQRLSAKRLASDEGFDDGTYRNGHPGDVHTEPARKKRKSSYNANEDGSPHVANGLLNGSAQAPSTIGVLPDHLLHNEYADVIDRGILSNSVAAHIYEHYTNDMAKHLPAVVFPSTMTAGGLRKSKPVLFLAILSIASGQDHPDLQRTLTREATKALADRVMCKAEKSLELVQAMQVLSIWHASEDQNDTQTFQLAQYASAMAIAMELGGPPLKGNLGISLLNSSTKPPSDFNSPEKRRTWLSCYTLSGSSCLPLRQTNVIRWSHFLENTLKLLETSPEATVTDKILCKWARLQHIMDRATELANTATNSPAGQSQSGLQQSVLDVLREARDFATSVGIETSYSLKLAAHEVDIYCHLVATKIEEFMDSNFGLHSSGISTVKPGQKPRSLSEGYVRSIEACAASIHLLLDSLITYLEMSSQTDLNSLPSFHFARIASSLVALLCIFFAASSPDSKVTPAIEPIGLKVDYYLPRLLELLRSTATDETKRPAQRFQLIVKMLNTWYERRKEGRKSPIKNELSEVQELKVQPVDDERNTPRLGYRKLSLHGSKAAEEEDTTSPTNMKPAQSTTPQPHKSNLPQGNTPLDLLSQVATNAPSAQAAQSHNSEWYSNATSYQPYQQPYPTEVAPPTDGQGMNGANGYGGLILDPALEQAMGMAFGSEGNIFPTFVDDFFGPMQAQTVGYGWYPSSEGG